MFDAFSYPLCLNYAGLISGSCHIADCPPPQLVPRPFVAVFVAMNDPPGPSMAATDGLPCCKWSPRFFTVLHGVSEMATKL